MHVSVLVVLPTDILLMVIPWSAYVIGMLPTGPVPLLPVGLAALLSVGVVACAASWPVAYAASQSVAWLPGQGDTCCKS